MTACDWQPGTQYNLGDVVEYQGARYRIIQPHTSQSDWAPPIVPALWGRIPDSECQSQGPYNPPDKGRDCGQDVQRPNDSYQQPNQSVGAPHEEQKGNWFNDHKKELEIGGGIVAGAAALAGAGYAYRQHQQHRNSDNDQPVSQGPQRDDERRTEGLLHNNRDKLVAGGLAAGAAAIGSYAYHEHQSHKNSADEQQAPSQGQQPDARERAEEFLHDNKNKLIAGGLAAGAAAIGGYAYRQHQNHKNSEEQQAPPQGQQPDARPDPRERAEEFVHDNKNKLIAGGLAAGAAAIGGYAYHQHQNHKNSEEQQALSQQQQPDTRERAEEFLHDNKNKLIAGGLAAGAAAIGGYAYHQHQKRREGEEEDQALSQIRPPPGPPPGAPDNEEKLIGGLAAGVAALGIGGYAYHEHEKHKKERAQEEARTQEYDGRGSGGPTTWVLVEGRENIPRSAIEAGRDRDNHPIYIARVNHENSLQIGKASPVFREGAAIGYAGRVVEVSKFEVLVGDGRAIRWVQYSYQLNLQELQARPVEGGREANGAPIYIARVQYSGGVHTAKIGEHLPAAHLAFSGSEVLIDDYEVLCYN